MGNGKDFMINRNRLEAPDHIDEIGSKRSSNNYIDSRIASLEERSRVLRERITKELDRHSEASIERTMALFSDSSISSSNKESPEIYNDDYDFHFGFENNDSRGKSR